MAAGPTIVAKFVADTSQMTGEVDKATQSAGDRMKGFAKGAALALGGAFVVDKLVDFGKAAVDAAAADAEAQAILASTLKNTTGATNDQVAAAEAFISKLSGTAAIADDELRPALGTLARAFGDTGKAQDALSVATDVAAGTGKDLSTVTDAMAKAAMGNVGALQRLGIETKNADGSTKSLDQIMGDMAKTFSGQAAVAAETTAGKMRGAKIQMGELSEQIGTALLPVLGTLSQLLVGTVLPAISKTFGWIMDHQAEVLAAMIGLGVVVGAVVIPAFISWAVAAGTAAIATLAAAAPFIAIGAVIAAVAYIIIKNWDTIVAASKAAWDAVTGAVAAAFNWVKANWPLLLAIITGPIGIATKIIVDNWQTIKDGATAVYQWIKDKFDAIAGAIGSVVGAISSAIGRVVDAIKAPINAIIGAWNGLEFRVPTFTLPSVHVPGTNIDFGGGTYGGQVIGFPNLPKLAAGGVLTSPTLFVGGEAGTEIVAPESLLRAIIAEEAGGHYTLNIYPRTADAADVAYGFRRLELMAGIR
jgi:hypothetical protein